MSVSKSLPVVVDTHASRHARLRPVPLTAVRLADEFWEPRRQINRQVTLPSQYRYCEETGRIDNFRRAAGQLDQPFQGIYFNDSDVYKWLEAAAWSLASDDDPALRQTVERVVDAIAAAQQPDGYLNTYFMFDKAAERWSNFDLHEMYCAGHLFQAAVAHARATGSTRLLDVATRLADHICATFGPPESGRRLGVDGHPEVEMALVELARATGNRRYLEQAQFFLDVRGQGLLGMAYGRFDSSYHQDHQPFRELDKLAGHAVRALYLNAGAADLYAETGEQALRSALERLWHNLASRRMYLSGGVGSRYEGEALGQDYELPNARAYAETCAAIASLMWNWRMLALEGDARYADLLEQTLYNGVLAGLSLDGQSYFYQNPLADDGSHRRQPWFGCACCPPNVARLLAALPGYCYSTSQEGVWLHLYAQGSARIELQGGQLVALSQHTHYPWDGEIAVELVAEGEFSLFLRIPGWCEKGAALELNGEPVEQQLQPGSYVEVRRLWRPGDGLRLRLPMPVRRIESHPYALENAGRVALMRGPLLYCLEQVDNPGIELRDVVLPADAAPTPSARRDLLNGVVVLSCQGELAPPDEQWARQLYRSARAQAGATRRQVELTAIPYYAWANREPGALQVWLRSDQLRPA